MNLIKDHTRHRYANIIILILLITISPYILFAFFSVPSADDFAQAVSSLEKGNIGYVINNYLKWGGRYSYDFILSFLNVFGHKTSKYFMVSYYYFIPLFLIAIYTTSSYIFISLISKNARMRWKLVFSLISTIFMLSSVDLSSTIFWWSGGLNYTLPHSLFLISFAITLSTIYINSSGILSLLLTILNVILILLISGFNEALIASNVAVISIIFFSNLILKTLKKNEYLKLLFFEVSAIISALVAILAPGNAARFSADGKQSNITIVTIKSLWSTFHNILDWINPLWLCLCVLLLFVLSPLLSDQLKLYIKDKRKFIPTIISLGIALYMSYFVRNYSLGNEGPPRTNSLSLTIFFVSTVFLCLYILVKLDSPNLQNFIRDPKKALIIVMVFCILSIAKNGQLLKDELVNLRSHYEYYHTIYPKLATAGPDAIVELQPEPRVSIVRGQCYLTDDKNYWVNQSVAKYFNVRSVTVLGEYTPASGCGGIEEYKKHKQLKNIDR